MSIVDGLRQDVKGAVRGLIKGPGFAAAALVTLAAAILVKEVAIIALVPWVWAALRRRDRTPRRQLASVSPGVASVPRSCPRYRSLPLET